MFETDQNFTSRDGSESYAPPRDPPPPQQQYYSPGYAPQDSYEQRNDYGQQRNHYEQFAPPSMPPPQQQG